MTDPVHSYLKRAAPQETKDCLKTFEGLFSMFSGATPTSAPKKVRMTPNPMIDIGISNKEGDNNRFFQHLFEALSNDPTFNLNNHLDRLVKVHGDCNGVDAKLGIHTFLTRVFSSQEPKSEREAKQLVLKLYLYCDLIDSEETFNTLKGKIVAKLKNYPTLLTYLEKLHFSDSSHKRLLISLFEDPDQSQFHLDFHRTDFVNKDSFKPLVNSLFDEDPKLRKQFLNFFHQGAKTYSVNKILMHPQIGKYTFPEGTFFLREENGKLHFGFTLKALGPKPLTHHLEFTFKSTGKTLIDRLESCRETLN